MKFIIEGSREELCNFITSLVGYTETTPTDLPPLLTELAEDEKINELAEAIRNVGKENALQVKAKED